MSEATQLVGSSIEGGAYISPRDHTTLKSSEKHLYG